MHSCFKHEMILSIVCLTYAIYAAPQIEITPLNYTCEDAIYGKTTHVKAVFTIRNTGDEDLKINSVRPDCGCTVVKYDKIIAPGKTTQIKSEVDIRGYPSGPLVKSITIVSNAANNPTIRVKLEALIKSPVTITPSYIMGFSGSELELSVTSDKKDLNISSIQFKTDEQQKASVNTSTPLNYQFSPVDSTTSDGFTCYELLLTLPEVTSLTTGKFIVTSNHDKQHMVILSGAVNKQ